VWNAVLAASAAFMRTWWYLEVVMGHDPNGLFIILLGLYTFFAQNWGPTLEFSKSNFKALYHP